MLFRVKFPQILLSLLIWNRTSKKNFEAIFRPDKENERNRMDRNLPQLHTIFFKTPTKINYNLYTYTPQKQSIELMAMSQIKGKRTGMQPIYHKRNIVVRQGGSRGQ